MKSSLDFPGSDRFLELYRSGVSFNDMAKDPKLVQDMLPEVANERTRSWKLYYKEKELVNAGALERRPRRTGEVKASPSHSLSELIAPERVSFYEEHLQRYEEMIGAPTKEPRERAGRRALKEETIVISDLHCPEERGDLIAEIIQRHRGANLVIAGDLDDLEMMSRFDHVDWTGLSFQESLAHRDALLDKLTEAFSSVEIMLGNHDLRLPRRAAKALGPDYAFISQQFLMWAYEKRHGLKVITNDVRRYSGRPIPYLHYYHQVGDCVIGHVEVAGRPVAKSSGKAHDFFTQWQRVLGLKEFNVLLQAHSHRQSFFRHPDSGVHCFEIGALCDIPSYSLTSRQSYCPPQLGYFQLIQYQGVTDVNASRLYSFE